jgi:Flp pilus assembly protein TadD
MSIFAARNDRSIKVAVCIFLTAIVWTVFGQALRYDFVNFDDDRYVYENEHITAGVTVEGLRWFLTHSHANLWHPLTTLSHMVDCQIYGVKPAGHHFTNFLLHNVAAVLLFLLLGNMTGSLWRSAFVAAIFAVHPMRVESVAWIAERKDVLSGVFFILTLAAYLRYVRGPSVGRYITMSIFLACGLMSKATFVTVPLVLLLLDYWPLARMNERSAGPLLLLEKIPLFLLSGVAALITVFAQTVTMATLDQLPLLPRLKNAVVSLVLYLRQTFWPTDLAVFYPHPHDQLNIWLVSICAALLVAITLFAIFVRQKHPYLLVGWFWFLILVAPVTGIFQAGLQARADRFTYLPHIGISIAIAWSCADLTQQWRNRQLILAAAATFIIAACAVLAFKQTRYWRDSVTLWRHAVAATSENQTARQNLAAALWTIGKTDEARKESRAGAIAHARTVLNDFPLDIATHNDLGVLLIQTGDVRGGISQWETSLEIDPSDGNALNNLAWVLATFPQDQVRNGKRAVELAAKATALPGGESPLVLRTLAAAYAEAGEFSQAVSTAQRAIDLATAQKNPSLATTLRHELDLYQANTPYREAPPP